MGKFKETKEKYLELKDLFLKGKLSKEEFKAELHKLIIEDEKGVKWSIGEKSGKWYFLENGKWIEGTPEEEKYIECPQCGFQNPPGSKVCAKCGYLLDKKELRCPNCKSIVKSNYNYCPYCGYQIGKRTLKNTKTLEIISLSFKSFFVFFGGIGIFLGIILGAYVGVSYVNFPFLNSLPSFFTTVRHGLKGGMLYGILGALIGFIIIGISGIIIAAIYNFLSFLFRGISLRIKDQT